MSIIHVGCELRYRVTAPTSFLFNVAVAHTTHQAVRQEHFTIVPQSEYTVEQRRRAKAIVSSVSRPKLVTSLCNIRRR